MNLTWNGEIEINGTKCTNILDSKFINKDHINIMLYPCKEDKFKQIPLEPIDNHISINDMTIDKKYKLTVKSYMTTKSSPEFNFMAQWNEDNPMPFRTMVGRMTRQTKGMVYMKLNADITQEITTTCMKCGRPITNPISQYFGVGPECGGHNYVNPFKSEQDLRDAIATYKQTLKKIKWEGWIIKSAIQSLEEIHE